MLVFPSFVQVLHAHLFHLKSTVSYLSLTYLKAEKRAVVTDGELEVRLNGVCGQEKQSVYARMQKRV